MLKKLKKIDLQIDIEKCEFFEKKIIFLNVILSINDSRINSKKNENHYQLNTFYKLEKKCKFSWISSVFTDDLIVTFRKKSKLSFEWSKNSWILNKLQKSKKSSIFSKKRWRKFLYCDITIESNKSFWKSIFQITSTREYYFNTTTKNFCISLFFTIETWFQSNAITKFTTKNCYLLFVV